MAYVNYLNVSNSDKQGKLNAYQSAIDWINSGQGGWNTRPQWQKDATIAQYQGAIGLVKAGNDPGYSERVFLDPYTQGNMYGKINTAYQQNANANFSEGSAPKDVQSDMQKARLGALTKSNIGGLSSVVKKRTSPTLSAAIKPAKFTEPVITSPWQRK